MPTPRKGSWNQLEPNSSSLVAGGRGGGGVGVGEGGGEWGEGQLESNIQGEVNLRNYKNICFLPSPGM